MAIAGSQRLIHMIAVACSSAQRFVPGVQIGHSDDIFGQKDGDFAIITN
jgi:hypothetical protein